MNTCETCKHWRVPPLYAARPHGQCKAINDDRGDQQIRDDTPVYIFGDEFGYLRTLPSFGCALHEQKTPATKLRSE